MIPFKNIQSPNAALILGVLFGLLLFFLTGSLVWARSYHDRIAPHVFVGPIEVGGQTGDEAQSRIQKRVDDILTQKLDVLVNDEARTLSLTTIVGDQALELIHFDIGSLVEQMLTESHATHPLFDVWNLFTHLIGTQTYAVPVTLAKERMRKDVYALFPGIEEPASETAFVFSVSTNGQWTGEVQAGHAGKEFDFDRFFSVLHDSLSKLDNHPVTLPLVAISPSVRTATAERQLPLALAEIESGPWHLEWIGTNEKFEWTLEKNTISTLLVPTVSGVQIDEHSLNIFLDAIVPEIEREAEDARFRIEQGRVVEFTESKEGRKIDRGEMLERFTHELEAETREPIKLALVIQEPSVTTGEVNTLGITEPLGIGTSSYRGSPKNRKENIQNGVSLLNGLLIAPGETFSLLAALKPFTLENGYLPELVIKGEKITPEIGGGLCQIGTTTFRAAMMSGLPILERRNHSLVVSYYNDPSNKAPGTDATIYDPAPDLKFVNDTGNTILFEAENLLETQELRFTFWGTSDGRKGSYEPPTVLRWIPVGETRYIETTNLEPGKTTCQESHIGADATFVYRVEKADGTIEETSFDSHYRPLPKMCLVGIEPEPKPEEKIETKTDPSEEQNAL